MRLPYHKYIGPGNSLDEGSPVDFDDYLALEHDKTYEGSTSDSDIIQSDKQFASDFFSHWVETGHIPSLIGAAGLKTKSYIEIIGLLYAKAKVEGFPGRIQDFQKTQSASLVRKINDLQELKNHYATGGASLTNKGPQATSDFDDLDGAGPSHAADPDLPVGSQSSDSFISPGSSDMDVDVPPVHNVQPAGSNKAITADGGGGRGGHGSLANQPGNRYVIYKTPKLLPVINVIEHDWIFYSYAYANVTIKTADNFIEWHTTPLALIPVDYLPFYLTESEYISIPDHGLIKHVSANVVCLGSRIAFDYGTTLTGVANSEHVAIGLSAVGLNLMTDGANKAFEVADAEPMIATSLKDGDIDNFYKKLYEGPACNIMNVPRAIDMHWCMKYGVKGNQTTDSTKYQNYEKVMPVRFDRLVTKFLIHGEIGQQIAHYEYKPHFAPCGTQKLGWNVESDNVFINRENLPWKVAGNAAPVDKTKETLGAGDITLDPSKGACLRLFNTTNSMYVRQLDMYHAYTMNGGANKVTTAQPQLHVGMAAIPSLNPQSNTKQFQNGCIYFHVHTTCVVEHDINSSMANGYVCYSDRVDTMFHNPVLGYTTGKNFLGAPIVTQGDRPAKSSGLQSVGASDASDHSSNESVGRHNRQDRYPPNKTRRIPTSSGNISNILRRRRAPYENVTDIHPSKSVSGVRHEEIEGTRNNSDGLIQKLKHVNLSNK